MIGLLAGAWIIVETMGLGIIYTIIFNIAWNELAPIYFDFLPDKWQAIPFWHIFGLIMIIHIVGEVIPKLIKISQKNKNTK